ncbi:hypothetical protein K502DRAFT_326398 [Neoconidiobolus thromboides FSU 785]|nr:hypothetical protein K502DRAFT_326398 [Neoconidiobolus thromboides FSU 785]
MNHYEVLNINETEFNKQILRKRYQELVLKHHPDKQKQRGEKEDQKIFEKIQKAYFILSNEELKHVYDLGLNERRLSQPGVIDQIVEIDDFTEEEEGIYTFPCRCGEYYLIEDIEGVKKELEVGLSVLINCVSCSLLVDIHC